MIDNILSKIKVTVIHITLLLLITNYYHSKIILL